MKYFLLAQWVKENAAQSLQIERVLQSSAELVIAFKAKKYLVFHYKTSSPILYFADEKIRPLQNGQTIWANLNQAELYAAEIEAQDRIITFKIRHQDIYQTRMEYRLIFECMPPKANLILCTQENGRLLIKDALLKYTYADNPQRQILKGLEYESPQTDFTPQREEVAYPLAVKPALQGEAVQCFSMNDYFYYYLKLVLEQKELLQKKQALQAKWQRELVRAEKKLAKQQAELKEADQLQTWLSYSEAIKVSLQKMKKGDAILEAVNYYDPELKTISIPLLTDKSPQENLKFYVKKYRKARQGKEKIQKQIEKTESDITHIKEVLSSFETERWRDLDNKTARPHEAAGQLRQSENVLKLAVNEDWEILIGRKAKENDLISTQIGKSADWWFHTRIYRGSHILLRNFHKKEPPPELVELCCSLAAWFSKARHSENVPVDYTQIRYVRKPRKSAPGYVTYTNQKTVFANPLDVSAVREILNRYAN